MSAFTGACGANTVYSYNLSRRLLTISGTGPMTDLPDNPQGDWREILDGVEEVLVTPGVTTVGSSAFFAAPNLRSVTLPETLRTIGVYAFSQCPVLEELTIPEGVEAIRSKAFRLSGLRKLHLPGSLKYIDMKALEGVETLREVTYAGTKGEWSRVQISPVARGNEALTTARITFAPVPAVPEWGARFPEAAEYLLDHDFLAPEAFTANRPGILDIAAEALYRKAGAPGTYISSGDWARRTGIAAGTLPEMLYRFARFNGKAEGQDPAAWYASKGYPTPDNRENSARALAAFLQSDEAEADRSAEQVRRIRELVANKGDGRFHVFMLNIITPGLKGKPGDSTLMIFPKGKTMLLDAAVTASGHWVVELLEKAGIDRLDYMAASHPHIDHVGGMAEVIDSLHKRGGSVGEFWYPGRDCKGYLAEIRTHLAEETPFRSFVTGDVETIDGVTIRFYNPSPEDLVGVDDTAMLDVETGNNVSLAMHFTFGRATFLASGDLYAGKEATVAQRFGSALHADIMKANHHGAYTSNTEVWLDTVAPKIVYAISDDNGCYELVERTEKRGIAYYTMGMDGSTLLSVDENRNFEILTQKNSTLHHTYKGIIGRM